MAEVFPQPVSLPFEPTADDVRQLCRAAVLKVPSPAICSEIAEALGHIARMLAQRIHSMDRPEPTIALQQRAFWKAMDLLDYALPGLHPLYGLLRVHPPGETKGVDGHAAFERLMGAMETASKFVPRVLVERPVFDVEATIVGLLALYKHGFSAPAGQPVGLSSEGPAPRFIKEALRLVSGVEMSSGAIYQQLLKAKKSKLEPDCR